MTDSEATTNMTEHEKAPVESVPSGIDPWQQFIGRATSVVTIGIKIFGALIAGHEAFFTAPPRDPIIFGVAAFMMAGATGLENIVGNWLGGKKQ